MRYTVFKIESELFGVDIHRVVEILNPRKYYKIPELPDFICGVINVRGDIIPVIDVRIRFGIAEKASKQRILLLRLEGDRIGLLVDDVTEIMEIPEGKISKPPKLFKGFRTEFIKGLGQGDGGDRVIIILDIEKVLSTEEKVKLKISKEKLKSPKSRNSSPRRSQRAQRKHNE